jgi:hypothetical protein
MTDIFIYWHGPKNADPKAALPFPSSGCSALGNTNQNNPCNCIKLVSAARWYDAITVRILY